MKKIIFFISVISLFLGSCSKIFYDTFIYDKSAMKGKLVFEKDDKTIVLIPVYHVNSLDYYTEIRDYIAQQRKDNYVVYYEGVGGKYTPEEKHILSLKQRKILGHHLTPSFTDETNLSLPKWLKNKKYHTQDYEYLGIVDTDMNIDLDKKTLIQMYEKQFGEIVLEPCDYDTPLHEPYKCKKEPSDYYYTRKYRDQHLVKNLVESNDQKIIVIYGKAHKFSLYPNLLNAGFTLKEGKLTIL